MKPSLSLPCLAIAGLLIMPILSLAAEKLPQYQSDFIKKCAAECKKAGRKDCASIRAQLDKFLTASSMLDGNNQSAADDMNAAGNRLADMCPKAMASRGF